MSGSHREGPGRLREWVPTPRRLWAGLAVAVVGPIMIAGLLFPLRGQLDGAVFGLAMILPTAVGAAVGGPVAAVVAVLVGSVTHNLLFTQPYLNFRVAATTDVVDLLVHTIVAVAVSHDLRTPLAAIAAAASELQAADVVFTERERAVMASTIVEQTARLDRTVENLLDAGRLQSSTIVLSPEAVEVEDLLSEALDGLLASCPDQRVRVHVAPDTRPAWVDPPLAVAALRNVLDNALRHTPASEMVDVHAGPAGHGVRISVVDHGPGLQDEDLTAVFTPFHSGAGGGIGLGLAIARGFVEAHGGHIQAADGPEGGAVFDLVLPAIDEPAP